MRSLKRELILRGTLNLGLLLLVLFCSIFAVVRHSLYRELDHSITETAALLAKQVKFEKGKIIYEWQEGLTSQQALAPHAIFAYWNNQSGEVVRSPALNGQELPKFSGVGGKPQMREIQLPGGNPARAIGLEVYPFMLNDEKDRLASIGQNIDLHKMPQTLVVAGDAGPLQQTLITLGEILIFGFIVTLCLIFFVIQHAVELALKPVDDLAKDINQRSDHELDAPLVRTDHLPLELKSFASDFNAMLARLSQMRLRERDFIRHAAHELRTPVAGLQATTDLALSRERENSQYVEYLKTCHQGALEMGELVKRLTALARVGKTNESYQLQKIRLDEIVRLCVEPFKSRLEQRNLTLKDLSKPMPIWIHSDSTLLKVVINNLLDNAVSYATEASDLILELQFSAIHCKLILVNQANDLPKDLNRLFEPLFRKDEARQDNTSHLGIGLTLAQEAAKTMKHELSVSSPEEGMICFTLDFERVQDCG